MPRSRPRLPSQIATAEARRAAKRGGGGDAPQLGDGGRAGGLLLAPPPPSPRSARRAEATRLRSSVGGWPRRPLAARLAGSAKICAKQWVHWAGIEVRR